MGNYIVENTTMTKVIWAAGWITMSDDYECLPESMRLTCKDGVTRLWARLYHLNAIAVYDSCGGPLAITDSYPGKLKEHTPMESYKALRCLVYQCRSESTERNTLFKDLETLLNILANIIVVNSEQYAKAHWG